MSDILKIVFLFVLRCIAFANARSAPVGVVTCKASPEEVQIGENATVTCLFPFDISDMSAWMTVEYLPHNGHEHVELVDCMKHNTPKPVCKLLQQGYAIEGDVKTSLKLRITNISAQQTGRFVCHMMLPEGEQQAPETEMCSLSVRRVVTCKASPKQVEIGNDATVTCHFPYDVSQMSYVSVTVGHFPDNEPEREHAVKLVKCRKTNTPELECTESKTYVIEGEVTTSLKLRITNISAQHFGRFLCRMFPAEGVEIPKSEMCSVSVLGAVTCKASSKQVEIGNNATVNCHFPYDVSQMSSVSVTVGHFPDNETEREHAVALVECRKTNTSELQCTESKAYVIEGTVTTSLKLRITNISAQHSGRFLCRMFPAEGVEIPKSEMCSVSVLDVTPVPATVTTNYETTADVENNGSDLEQETNSVLIIAPVTGVVLVVVAVTSVIFVILYRKRAIQKEELKRDVYQSEEAGQKEYIARGQADADDETETDNDSLHDGDTQTDNEYDDVSEEDMENPFLPVNDKNLVRSGIKKESGDEKGRNADSKVGGLIKQLFKKFAKQKSKQKDKGGYKEHQHQMISLSPQGQTVVTSPQPSSIHPVVSSENTVRLMLVGKTGTGKSTTGNTILGQKLFASVTRDCERRVGTRGNTRIEIMDSPGLFDTGKNHDEIRTTIIKAVAGMHPGPHAILNVIKVGRYREEDHSAYGRFKAIFDNDVTKYVIIVFTHGDQLEQYGTTLAAVLSSPTAPANFNQVLRECGNRYILFNNNSQDEQTQVDELLRMVRKMTEENGNRPYSCPKYSKIGEELEEEVSKRMAKYEKRELQTNAYVQQLKAQTNRAEQRAAETWEEFKRKEAQREKEVRKVEERRKELEQDLKNQQARQEDIIQKWQTLLDEQKQQIARLKIEEQERKKKSISKQRSNFKQELEKMKEKERKMQELVEQQRREDEQRKEAAREELTRLEQEKREILEQHEQQRRAQMEEMDRINRELKEKMAKENKVQREQQRRAEIERQREMEELKSSVVIQKNSSSFGM